MDPCWKRIWILTIALLFDHLFICGVVANTYLSCENQQGESYSSDGCVRCTCINGETFCETIEGCQQRMVLLDKRGSDPCPYGKYYHNGENWCGCKNGITSCVKRDKTG